MSLKKLEFTKMWTAGVSSEKYIPATEDSELQARADLQVQHDDTARWADELIDALTDSSNLGTTDDYTSIVYGGQTAENTYDAIIKLRQLIQEQSEHQILPDSITQEMLKSGTNAPVGKDNIQGGAVTHAKLSKVGSADQAAVWADNIQNGEVTQAKLSAAPDQSLGGSSAAVDYNNIRSNAVRTFAIKDGAVTQEKLATTDSQGNGGAVATNNIKQGAVTKAKLGSDVKFDAADIISGTFADARIPDLNASKITDGTISSDRLPTVPIAKGGTGATTAANARTNLEVTKEGKLKVGDTEYTLRIGTTGAAGYITFVV